MGGSPTRPRLFEQQAVERDRRNGGRASIASTAHGGARDCSPRLWFRVLMAVGRVAGHAINVIPMYPFPALEEMR